MDKKYLKALSFRNAFLVMASFVVCLGFILYDKNYALFMVATVLLAWLAYHVYYVYSLERWIKIADHVLSDLGPKLSTYVDTASMPMALTDDSNTIRWQNPAFTEMVGAVFIGKDIYHVISNIDKPSTDKSILIGDKKYFKEAFNHLYKNKDLTLHRMIDPSSDILASSLYQKHLSVVSIIQIDNFDELAAGKENISTAEISYVIEKELDEFTKPINGLLKKFDRDKYLLIFERKHLAALIQSKFDILDRVSGLNIDGAQPTISIAIGVSNNLYDSHSSANKSLELALGRGGNQAVIKRKDKFSFYGGPKGSIVRSSKVKSRMFSHALKNLMEQCDQVFVMGHSMPDLDCLGSSMGVVCCARHIEIPAYIVLDPPTASLDYFIDNIKENEEYEGVIISSSEALNLISPSSLLIVVDTQIETFSASPALLESSETTVVVDHHLRGANNIENAALYYHEPFASSAAELVTEIIQYFDDAITLLPIEAEALLSGITIDTKGFSFKTGVRTFEAASYLRKSGADTTTIRQHFKDDLDTFIAKSEVVKTAEILKEGIAIAFCPEGTDNSQVIAAQAADTLVSITGINTSFVFSMQNNDVLISGRSIGEENVQLILERLGGGGHASIAGARLENITFEKAKKKLLKAMDINK
jgi:cyclic-di-AMP phosphodiesterase